MIGLFFLPFSMIIINKIIITYIIKSIYGLAIGYSFVMFCTFIIYINYYKKSSDKFWDNIDNILLDNSIEVELVKSEVFIH